MDHSAPTLRPGADGERPCVTEQAREPVATLVRNCAAHGIELFDWDSPDRGIVHVVGRELGLTQPGMTVVCGDSHTSTHGASGAFAFGIGTSEVGHVLATQALLQRKARTMRVAVGGRLPAGVSTRDLALAIVARVGVGAGTGHVVEFAGEAVAALSMEGRMTLCNTSIEMGVKAGMAAPDATTLEWLHGCPPTSTRSPRTGRSVASTVRVLVTPGSEAVPRAAEAGAFADARELTIA